MVERDRGKLVFVVWRCWVANVFATRIQAEADMFIILELQY